MDNQQCADLGLLALTIWREARGESYVGKVAVANCVMNRVLRPCWWGDDLWSVLTKRYQFSSITDPKDSQLTLYPNKKHPDWESWEACLEVAEFAVKGSLWIEVPGADSYFDESIPAPYWTKTARLVEKIGRLYFYDVDHDYEREVLSGQNVLAG